ncbi:MAG: preprotein translocase subunit SecA [Pirellula sp.]|nr:preprotein translocase subunit SecA [Pirellula sp.]
MLSSYVSTILKKRQRLAGCSDGELVRFAKKLKSYALSGKPLSQIMVDTYSLASESTRRVTGKSHYPVQIHAAIQMFHGRIVEMQTGEGKTITAVLPVVLRAFAGLGCHVLTANEYLATRDAKLLTSIYELLGLSVGSVTTDMDDQAREIAYAKDVTYTTSGEVGFDFLRDTMKRGTPDSVNNRSEMTRPVHRGFYFALIDEADSILIDDARTPLIIGSERSDEQNKENLCRWACDFAANLSPSQHFILNPRRRTADLSEYGCRQVLLSAKPSVLAQFNNEEIFKHIEQAIVAKYFYLKERDYIVMEDDSIVIVDEGSGRVMEERKWQQGLHQAIEAKEKVRFSPANSTAARVTLQSLFRKYDHLTGMTGTAYHARGELRSIYKIGTRVVPTNRPCIREQLPTRMFIDISSKQDAIVDSIRQLIGLNRSVLIGTPSVEASESLSKKLTMAGILHQVLNCRSHGREAEIVALAGQSKAVTIATNMAGRGTDILLDDEVRSAGGLHVIATERHTSVRIDRQLVGRCARQGDPGSFQFFLSMEDELFRSMKADYHAKLIAKWKRLARKEGELPAKTERIHVQLQRTIEKLHTKSRKELLKHEKQRLKSFIRMSLDPCIELLNE